MDFFPLLVALCIFFVSCQAICEQDSGCSSCVQRGVCSLKGSYYIFGETLDYETTEEVLEYAVLSKKPFGGCIKCSETGQFNFVSGPIDDIGELASVYRCDSGVVVKEAPSKKELYSAECTKDGEGNVRIPVEEDVIVESLSYAKYKMKDVDSEKIRGEEEYIKRDEGNSFLTDSFVLCREKLGRCKLGLLKQHTQCLDHSRVVCDGKGNYKRLELNEGTICKKNNYCAKNYVCTSGECVPTETISCMFSYGCDVHKGCIS
jgi:hypothetical protein